MFRVSITLQVSAICILFLARPNNGGPLSSSNQEENGSISQDLVYGPVKREVKRLKSNNTTQRTVYGPNSNSDEAIYFATHRTNSGSPDDNYYGLLAMMDVYGHKLERGQWSSTGVWVTHPGDDAKSTLNSVDAGWHIFPEKYGDSRPRFFTSWTRDGYQSTGCFNEDCPGFVPAKGAMIAPGAVIDPVSDDSHQQSIIIKVFKEKSTGDWWVYYGFNSVPTAVGYYPKSLFTYLSQKATVISFGAFVSTNRTLPTPPMGRGIPPNGQGGRVASFRDLQLVDFDGISSPIMSDLPSNEGNKQCYSISPVVSAECFYGGPGGCV